MGQVGPTPLATVLSYPYQISSSTDFQLTLHTYIFDLNTFTSTSPQLNITFNRITTILLNKFAVYVCLHAGENDLKHSSFNKNNTG